ncbi:MAG: aminodeoxychorismate synthase component I [Arsenophonus sp.]|nr:MAG: aminodeoxychorismate synthase component I [Arsenophonus sp.]
MKMKKKQLPYSLDAALKYFKIIHKLPWSILLYSGRSNHPYNRFDILSSDPVVTLETKGNITEIIHNNKKIISKSDPFKLIQKKMDFFNIKTSTDNNIPFQGGVAGIWSYDLVRRIENLPKYAEKKLTFPDMAVGIYLWAIIIDHYKKKITLISYEDINKRLVWLNKQRYIKTKKFSISQQWKSNISKKEYFKKIEQIYNYLINGDCYQINLAKRFYTKYKGDEWNCFIELSKKNLTPFSAFLRLKKHTLISLSPERFLQIKNNLIQTRPIKGTAVRLENKKKDKKQIYKLITSKKDRTENIMIVDLLRNDIGKIAVPGSVSVKELFVVESFPSVHHLISTIIAKLPNNIHPINLLKSCFPGGSITGVPKLRAMEIIETLEPHRRYCYSGSIGYISFCGTMDTNINIRTLMTENNFIYCWCGGGIILESIAQKEYQEILDKLNKILPIF